MYASRAYIGGMSTPGPRDARLNLRLTTDAKATLERAAAAQHQNLSEFCLGAALDKARDVLRPDGTLILSAAERQRFVEILMNPPEPNERLMRGVEEYRRRVVSE